MNSVTILKSTIGHLGGLEKYSLRLCQAFKNANCHVQLLTTGNIPKTDLLEDVLVKSHNFTRSLSVYKVKEFDAFCTSELKKHPSPIIFGLDRNKQQTHIRAGNGVHKSFLEQRKKSSSLLKSLSFGINPLHRLILSIEKASFENPKLKVLFTNSHMVKREILTYYQVDEKKIHVIHNGVEWSEMQSSFHESLLQKNHIAKELGLDPNVYQYLFAGHNFARKGLNELLEALSHLRNKDIHLSVVGEDKNLSFFKKRVEKLGLLSKVTFFGKRRDMIKFYQVADCLVIPSHYDPFANVTLEALAMGLYVISSSTNGASEIITQDCGRVIDLVNTEEFIEALYSALAHPKDQNGAASRRNSIQHLDFPNQLSKMVNKTLLSR